MLLMLFLQTTASTSMFAFLRLAKYLRAPSALAVIVVAGTMNNQEVHQHQMNTQASFDDHSVVFSNAIPARLFSLCSGVVVLVVVSF